MTAPWLGRFAWYRRRVGGHWERWFVDFPVASHIWFRRRDGCAKVNRRRPGLCFGNPHCEEHG